MAKKVSDKKTKSPKTKAKKSCTKSCAKKCPGTPCSKNDTKESRCWVVRAWTKFIQFLFG
jgi:hypothetical protein